MKVQQTGKEGYCGLTYLDGVVGQKLISLVSTDVYIPFLAADIQPYNNGTIAS